MLYKSDQTFCSHPTNHHHSSTFYHCNQHLGPMIYATYSCNTVAVKIFGCRFWWLKYSVLVIGEPIFLGCQVAYWSNGLMWSGSSKNGAKNMKTQNITLCYKQSTAVSLLPHCAQSLATLLWLRATLINRVNVRCKLVCWLTICAINAHAPVMCKTDDCCKVHPTKCYIVTLHCCVHLLISLPL